MKKLKDLIFLFLIFILVSFLASCSKSFKNKQKFNNTYSLYKKGNNKYDDEALLEAVKIYQEIINQKAFLHTFCAGFNLILEGL